MKANLKVAIELQGTTVAQVAVALGKQPGLISHVIQGRIEPDPELRRRIAEVLNADERWLFRDVTHVPSLIRSGRKQCQEPSGEIAGANNVAG